MNRFNQSYWESRYQEQHTGWDVGSVSTPMKEFIDSLTDKNLKILIPGAGNGHEFDYLISKGFLNVTIVDIAAPPLINLKNRHAAELHEQFFQQDFFDIQKKYELVLEQTFFCALDPHLRQAYAKKMYEILEPNGILAGYCLTLNCRKLAHLLEAHSKNTEVCLKRILKYKNLNPASIL